MFQIFLISIFQSSDCLDGGLLDSGMEEFQEDCVENGFSQDIQTSTQKL